MDVAGLELDKDKKYSLAHALAGVIRYALLMRDWKMASSSISSPHWPKGIRPTSRITGRFTRPFRINPLQTNGLMNRNSKVIGNWDESPRSRPWKKSVLPMAWSRWLLPLFLIACHRCC